MNDDPLEDKVNEKLDSMKEQIKKDVNIIVKDSLYIDLDNIKKEIQHIRQRKILRTGDYYINSPIRIEDGGSLEIEPGTTLSFSSKTSIYGKNIQAIGTPDQIIRFKPGYREWNGISIEDDFEGNSILKYCHITGSKSSGISITNSNPTISNCEIMNNKTAMSGGGIRIHNSEPIIKNCIIKHNSANIYEYGGGIFMDQSGGKIIHCTIEFNEANKGGGIYLKNSDPKITRTKIRNNTATGSANNIYHDKPIRGWGNTIGKNYAK